MKKDEAGGIGIIWVGALLSSDMRRGRADIISPPLNSSSIS